MFLTMALGFALWQWKAIGMTRHLWILSLLVFQHTLMTCRQLLISHLILKPWWNWCLKTICGSGRDFVGPPSKRQVSVGGSYGSQRYWFPFPSLLNNTMQDQYFKLCRRALRSNSFDNILPLFLRHGTFCGPLSGWRSRHTSRGQCTGESRLCSISTNTFESG